MSEPKLFVYWLGDKVFLCSVLPKNTITRVGVEFKNPLLHTSFNLGLSREKNEAELKCSVVDLVGENSWMITGAPAASGGDHGTKLTQPNFCQFRREPDLLSFPCDQEPKIDRSPELEEISEFSKYVREYVKKLMRFC